MSSVEFDEFWSMYIYDHVTASLVKIEDIFITPESSLVLAQSTLHLPQKCAASSRTSSEWNHATGTVLGLALLHAAQNP